MLIMPIKARGRPCPLGLCRQSQPSVPGGAMTGLAKQSSAKHSSSQQSLPEESLPKESSPKESPAKRQLLLASDRFDQSFELAEIMNSVGEVHTIPTSEIPEVPASHLSGIVVDINLRSAESVQKVRSRLRGEAYRAMPRLFVLADALHPASMQAWALGATDTISRPFDAAGILHRISVSFPDTVRFDATASGKALNRGIEAAHAVMVKILQELPAGVPLTFADIV